MCKVGVKPVFIPQDNTRVAPKFVIPNIATPTIKPQGKVTGHSNTPHSVSVDPKLQKAGQGSNPHKIVDDHHTGHERGVLYKAKEEATIKTLEKTSVKSSEKILEKVAGEVAMTASTHTLAKSAKPASKFVQGSAKVLSKIETNATGKAVTKTLAKVGHVAEHGLEKGIEKIAGKGIDKAATALATKVGVKTASSLARFVPVAGVAVNAYFTKHDYDDYAAKMKDPSVTKTSKALAGATVGLDVIATGASALAVATGSTVIGLPVAAVAEGVSWIATGASIVTSGLSEYWKH